MNEQAAPALTAEKKASPLQQLPTPLLYWYRANARSLPWRDDPTPYHVWLSEIMLQQTRVEAVKPYYLRFLRAYPDIPALANAQEEQLHKLWQGLGYYSRVRNLKKCAQQIMERHGGQMPADVRQLQKLAGIGPYTAGAIASIAFGLPEPAVDGNVLRVVTRLCADTGDIADQRVKERIAQELRAVYPPADSAAFTQALMELGALVCVPNGAPHCEVCPLCEFCGSAGGAWRDIPHKSPKKARKTERRTVYLLSCDGKYALVKRPASGLLAGLWEFVSAKQGSEAEHSILEQLREHTVGEKQYLGEAKHIFTHLEWHMSGWAIRTDALLPGFVWVSPRELKEEYAVPSAYRYFMKFVTDDPREHVDKVHTV